MRPAETLRELMDGINNQLDDVNTQSVPKSYLRGLWNHLSDLVDELEDDHKPEPTPAVDQPEIYRIGLHETHMLGETMIRRVPGGWIYHDYPGESGTPVFVPLNNEFQK